MSLANPEIMLSWSDDGGYTWTGEILLQTGMLGQYNWRVYLRSMGRSRDRIYRIVTSDAVPFIINDAYIDYTIGER